MPHVVESGQLGVLILSQQRRRYSTYFLTMCRYFHILILTQYIASSKQIANPWMDGDLKKTK